MQHGLERHGAVSPEHLLEIAKLVIGVRLHEQHANLLFAHAHQPLLRIVVGLDFVWLVGDFDHKFEFADAVGPIRQPQPLRLAVGAGRHRQRG